MKILIVDDSALMRRQISKIFEDAGGFEVKTARDGEEAVEMNLDFEPDVITLDINMPKMDGLTALTHIMLTRKVPVIMLSSLTEKGAMATFEALALGAVDYVPKPDGTISLSIQQVADELLAKTKSAAGARIKSTEQHKPSRSTSQTKKVIPSEQCERIVIIGVSTGGPSTLEIILPELPENYPAPVVVAQHMPAAFTTAFAKRLDSICRMSVVEVSKPQILYPGTIYIAKGGADIAVTKRSGEKMAVPKPESPKYLWHPSVELLGITTLEVYEPENITAVLLTGMGNDGADSFMEIKNKGGKTIAEAEETAVVFGMPKELIEQNGASLILPADKIGPQLRRLTL